MKKLLDSSPLGFALMWIGIYCVGMSVCDELSRALGIDSGVSAVFALICSLFLYLWLKKQGRTGEYGLCLPKIGAKAMLLYIPLAVITLFNLWGGISLPADPVGTVCFVLKMLCVGFLEELIFRGFLFKAMAKNSLGWAATVSAVTFGIGHIINLINGSGMSLRGNLVQIVCAVLIGLLYVVMFIKSGSLLLCIISHGVLNSLSAFSKSEAPLTSTIILCLLTAVYTIALIKSTKRKSI